MLRGVWLGELAVVLREQSGRRGMANLRPAEGPGHALDGDVVVRGADTARGEHHVPRAVSRGHLGRDHVDVVGDDRDLPHVHAEAPERTTEEDRAGVLDLARQDLVPDQDDAGGLRPALVANPHDWRTIETMSATR